MFLILLSLLIIATHGSVPSPQQERKNRLLPDFQPFQHPAKKIQDVSQNSLGSKQQGKHKNPKAVSDF